MKFDNERGYVLISVLAIIILLVSFSLILIPKALNTSLQVNKSELNTQSKDLSEMGIHYAHAYLQEQVIKAINYTKVNEPNINNQEKVFCEKIKSQFKSQEFITLSPKVIPMDTTNPKYKFKIDNNALITFKPDTIQLSNTTCTSLRSITIPITSTAIVNGVTEKVIRANFIIENTAAIIGIPGVSGKAEWTTAELDKLFGLNIITDTIDISGSTTSSLYNTAKFTKTVTLRGNGSLKVGGHAWFDATPTIDFKGNNGNSIYVSGDAYFKSKVSLGGAGKNYICVKGSVYLYENGKYVRKNEGIKAISSTTTEDPCPPSVNLEGNYYYDINGWGLIESNLNVEY